jgi:hypothetical protein
VMGHAGGGQASDQPNLVSWAGAGNRGGRVVSRARRYDGQIYHEPRQGHRNRACWFSVQEHRNDTHTVRPTPRTSGLNAVDPADGNEIRLDDVDDTVTANAQTVILTRVEALSWERIFRQRGDCKADRVHPILVGHEAVC